MDQPTTARAEPLASEIVLRIPAPRHPEDQLMLAVMADAVALLREAAYGGEPHSRREIRDTLGWFASDDTASPVAFLNICTVLRLDPGVLRAALERELAGVDGWRIRVRGGDVRAFPPPRRAPVTRAARRLLARFARRGG